MDLALKQALVGSSHISTNLPVAVIMHSILFKSSVDKLPSMLRKFII